MHLDMTGCILTTGTVQHLAVKPVAEHSDLTSAAVAGSFGAIQGISWVLQQIEVYVTYESSTPSRRHLRRMSGSTGGCRCPGYGWTRISTDFLKSFGNVFLPNSSLTALKRAHWAGSSECCKSNGENRVLHDERGVVARDFAFCRSG